MLLFLCCLGISRPARNLSSISYFGKLYAGSVRFVARYRSVMCMCLRFVGKRIPAMKRCHIRRGLSRVCEESSGPDEVTEDAINICTS